MAPPPQIDGETQKLECDLLPKDVTGDAPAEVNGTPTENGAPHENGDHVAVPAAEPVPHVEVGDLLGDGHEPPATATEAM